MRTHHLSRRDGRRSFIMTTSVIALFVLQPFPSLNAQDVSQQASADLTAETVRATVTEIAAIVAREYLDAEIGEQVADLLRRRLVDGDYEHVTTPAALATAITRDLLAQSNDKHLAVIVAAPREPDMGTIPPTSTRAEAVRRSNAGVQRVEILAGNVGYLNLTSFWRLDEAREAIADAMRLLSRADAFGPRPAD